MRTLLPLLAALLLSGCPKTSAPSAAALPEVKRAPTVTFYDLDGGPHTLSEFDGKVVLLDFWATWCGPCRQSLPLYNAWQQELGEDLVVVAISVDERLGPVAPFARANMPDVVVWHDRDHAGASTLELPAMPTAFLIDRRGVITEMHTGFERADAAAFKARLQAVLAQ